MTTSEQGPTAGTDRARHPVDPPGADPAAELIRTVAEATAVTPDPAAAVAAAGAPSPSGAATQRRQPADEEPLPSIPEMMAEQMGGVRGLVEGSVPVIVFVVANLVTSLRPAIFAAVGTAVAIAIVRIAQRRPIRYAVNGLVGVAVGALIAWRTGEERDFYLPGILYGIGYGLVLLGSVVVKQPLVGWLWSVIVNGGKADWRLDPRLVRTFNWLTVLWGVVWMIKVGIQALLYVMEEETLLGIARVVLGFPPYALLLAITIWTVRRVKVAIDAEAAAPATR